MPTQSVFANLSGTTWTLNVTAANLVADTSIKDFEVYFNSVLQSNVSFTKLTATSLQYNGAAMNTLVEVRRYTDALPFHLVSYRAPILSGDYNNNLEKISRKLEEIEAFPPGFATVPQILSGSYGLSWTADTVNAPSRSAVYAEIENTKALAIAAGTALQSNIDLKAPLASPALTGNPTAPTPTNSDNTTKIATTQFVNTALTASIDAKFISNRTPRLVASHAFSGSTSSLNITGLNGINYEFLFKASALGTPFPTVTNPFYYMRLNGVNASSTYIGEGFHVATMSNFDPNGGATLGSQGNIVLEHETSAVSTVCRGTITLNQADGIWSVSTTSQRHVVNVALNQLVIRTYAANGALIGGSLSTLLVAAWDNGADANVPATSTFELWLLN